MLLTGQASSAYPCTLVGIAYEPEIVIGKNRDRDNDYIQSLVKVTPRKGYRYLGIRTLGETSFTSGINEKGLVVVDATVRASLDAKERGIGELLTDCATVDGVLEKAKEGKIDRSAIIMAADKNGILVLEYYDRDHFHSEKVVHGVVVRTNHYLYEEMKPLMPRKPSKGSIARWERAMEAMHDRRGTGGEIVETMLSDSEYGDSPFSIARFHNGDDRGRTISSAIYTLKKDGSFTVKILLGNPAVGAYIQIPFNDPIPAAFGDGTVSRIHNALRESYERGSVSERETKEISFAVGATIMALPRSRERGFCDSVLKALREGDIPYLKKIVFPETGDVRPLRAVP